MGFLTSASAYHDTSFSVSPRSLFTQQDGSNTFAAMSNIAPLPPHSSHPALGHLVLLVFEAVLEVVCVSAPGYIVARQGMFDGDAQKLVANLNVMLFTPCLIFTKLASQLTADKLMDLAIIPVLFVLQLSVSYVCAIASSRAFGFSKRPRNFVIAMSVFGNSNSLPISLVISLSQTISGLHWDKIPGDTDNEVAARGILYLMIFQQLGQLVRWSWGYHVLLAPADKYEDEQVFLASRIEQGGLVYHDDPEEEQRLLLCENQVMGSSSDTTLEGDRADSRNPSGDRTPLTHQRYTASVSSQKSQKTKLATSPEYPPTPTSDTNGENNVDEQITSFPRILSQQSTEEQTPMQKVKGSLRRLREVIRRQLGRLNYAVSERASSLFHKLPVPVQRTLAFTFRYLIRFLKGLWAFMNPPLWAMVAAIIVASVPSLQHLFFEKGTFINNSVTHAVAQSGGVAVPLILVVLGANLARNTLPHEGEPSKDDKKEETRLVIACILSRMLFPVLIMGPIIALFAKYVPVSILDDPIFAIVAFLITGAPSALQLAQICQINGVYMGAMARLLFQSYVVWWVPTPSQILPVAMHI
ncbi:hypothetical protein MMC25_002123 [Agyrium rufum]|nr:hypothetical protein [Agyrium rufum]